MPSAVSVAMATYNGQRFLGEQLDSLVRQTILPDELIVSDDGSVDDTVAILQDFQRRAPFPVTIHQNAARLGYRKNFLQAASMCRAELVAFCDQDDIWEPTKLAVSAAPFEDKTVLMSFHNARLVDSMNRPSGVTFKAKDSRTFGPLELHPWLIVPGFSQMFRRQLTRWAFIHDRSVDPFQPHEIMAHDQYYFFWASVLGKIAYIPDILASYRQHEGNAIGWPTTGWRRSLHDAKYAAWYATGAYAAGQNRITLLDLAIADATTQELDPLREALRHYSDLTESLAIRRDLYESPRMMTRLRSFLHLLRTGVYLGQTPAELNLGTLALDMMIGVPFGSSRPLARRPHEGP